MDGSYFCSWTFHDNAIEYENDLIYPFIHGPAKQYFLLIIEILSSSASILHLIPHNRTLGESCVVLDNTTGLPEALQSLHSCICKKINLTCLHVFKNSALTVQHNTGYGLMDNSNMKVLPT